MPQKPPGIPITQAARVATFAQTVVNFRTQPSRGYPRLPGGGSGGGVGGVAELRATRWCAERLSKKGPASGGGA
jgi:hypothetical protein